MNTVSATSQPQAFAGRPATRASVVVCFAVTTCAYGGPVAVLSGAAALLRKYPFTD